MCKHKQEGDSSRPRVGQTSQGVILSPLRHVPWNHNSQHLTHLNIP